MMAGELHLPHGQRGGSCGEPRHKNLNEHETIRSASWPLIRTRGGSGALTAGYHCPFARLASSHLCELRSEGGDVLERRAASEDGGQVVHTPGSNRGREAVTNDAREETT